MEHTPQEPNDNQVHQGISIYPETLGFYRAAVVFYEELLKRDIQLVDSDPDLKLILDEKTMESLPASIELRHARFIRESIEKQLNDRNSAIWGVTVTHGWVRFVKSVAIVYLNHLRQKRDKLANRPELSRATLEAVDQRISALEEKTQIGVFRSASPYPVIVGQVPLAEAGSAIEDRTDSLIAQQRIQPVLLESIEIRDPELRKRCLDLFSQFRREGANDRLDTVVSEATRVLEDRLRSITSAPATCTGVDLAAHAFASNAPRLVVSEVKPEQEAAHLLFRGVFGFIRNSVHHKLVDNLQPERVLQIVGMMDYLLFVMEGARISHPS